MNKGTVVKRVVQGIAACYGILGVALILFAILFAIPTTSYKNLKLFMVLSAAISGILMLIVAYQNLRRFGKNSIKGISAIIALTFTGLVLRWFGPLMDFDPKSRPYYILLYIIPFVLLFVVYSILLKKLIRITQGQNIAIQSAPDPSEDPGPHEP